MSPGMAVMIQIVFCPLLGLSKERAQFHLQFRLSIL